MRKFLFSMFAVLLALNVNAQKEVTFDFDNNATALFGIEGRSNNSSNDGDITAPITATVDGVSVTVSPNEGGTTPNQLWEGSPVLRIYGGTMTIYAPGEKILKVKFVTKEKWDTTNNSFVPESAEEFNALAKVWTAPNGGVESLVINIGKNTQFKNLTVTLYEAPDPSDEIVDGIIDFSQPEYQKLGWAGDGVAERIIFENDVLHYESTEATANPWDIQYWLGKGVGTPFQENIKYTITIKAKGTPEYKLWGMAFGSWGGKSISEAITLTEDWSEQSFQMEGLSGGDGIMLQHGDLVGYMDIAWIKVSHTLADVTPLEDDPYVAPTLPEGWVNLIENGDAQGEYGEVPCVIVKSNVTGEEVMGNAPIEEIDGEKVFAIHAGAMKSTAWDNQMWICSPKSFEAGDKFIISFRYKAKQPATVGSQAHKGTSYLTWEGVGSVNFVDAWRNYTAEVTVSSGQSGMSSIAYNLNDFAEANDYYIDNIVWAAPENVVPADFQNILVNGDAEGNYATTPCVMAKVNEGDDAGNILPAKVAVEDGNKVFVVAAGTKVAEAWDNQLWIQSPVAFKAGDLVKVSFRYKAAKAAKASTQQHAAPGAYIHWAAIGDVNFTTDWQVFEGQFSAEKDGVQTVALNLSELAESNIYMLDDVQLVVDVNKIEVPAQEEGATPEVVDLNMIYALADMAWWEGLCGELTAAMAGNEEYITADTRMAIEEFMKEDNYPSAINAALEDATENGTVYACPFDKALIEAQVRGWIAEIEGIKNGEIALYTEGGIVGDATLNSNMPFYATPVGVEVYANQTVVVKGWDGVEGSDLKIAYTLRNTLEEGESVEPQLVITGIEQTVNGEVVSEFVEDEENPELSYVSLVPAEGSDYAGVMVYPFNEMTTVLVGKDEETGMGQVSLYGVWAKMPVATEPAEGEDAEVDPGFGQTELETVEAAYIVTWPGQPIINGIVWNNIKTQIAQVEDAIANYEAIVATMMYASQYEGEEVTAGVDAARAWVEATKAEYAAKAEAEELTFEDGVMGEMMEQLMNVSESLNFAAMYDVNRYGAAVTNLWIGDDDEFEGVRDALVAQIEALEVAGKSALEEKVNNIDQAWSVIAEAIATYTAYNGDTHAEIVALCEQTIAEIQALVAEVEEIANYLYTAEGKVGDGSDIDNSPFAGSEVEIEVNKNFVLVRGWDGTPGSDLKVYYTSLTTLEESENIEPQLVITGIEQIVDGEVVSELDEIGDDETVVRLYPQSDVYPMATIYVANEMTGIKLEENAGQIALMGDWQPASNLGGEDDNMGVAEPVEAVYMVTWPIYVEPVQPITEPREWQFTNDDDATAALASSVAEEYGYWASSSKGRYSYAKTIEKEELMLTPETKLPITEGLFFTMTKANDILVGTPAGNNGRLQLGGSAPVVYIPNCGAGDVVTITALWATKNASTITIDNGSCVLEEGADAVTSFDLTGSAKEYKITVTEDGDLALHSKAVVYTAIKVTPDPSTGISNATATVNMTTDAIYNLAGQKVDAQYKGIVIINGKKFLKK